MTPSCGKAQQGVSLIFLSHFDVCHLLLNRRTITWNLFALYDLKKKKPWYESKFLLKVTLYLRLCIDRSWLRTIQNAWADEGKARINFHAQKSRVTKTTVIVSPLVWDSIVRHCDRFSPEKIAFFPKKRFERASKHLCPLPIGTLAVGRISYVNETCHLK